MLEAVKPVLLEKVDNILSQSKSGIVFALYINLSQSRHTPRRLSYSSTTLSLLL